MGLLLGVTQQCCKLSRLNPKITLQSQQFGLSPIQSLLNVWGNEA